jgi:hypothetical protein
MKSTRAMLRRGIYLIIESSSFLKKSTKKLLMVCCPGGMATPRVTARESFLRAGVGDPTFFSKKRPFS